MAGEREQIVVEEGDLGILSIAEANEHLGKAAIAGGGEGQSVNGGRPSVSRRL